MTTWADRVRQLLTETGVKSAKLAKAIGVSGPALSNYLNGNRPLPSVLPERIAAFFGVNPSWVMYGVGKKREDELAESEKNDTVYIPLLTWEQAASYDASERDLHMANSSFKVYLPTTKYASCFALTVEGNSMEGTGRRSFFAGDTIIINPELKHAVKNGDFIVVKPTTTEAPILRQFFREGGRVHLIALNPSYSKIDCANDPEIVGVVVHKMETLHPDF